MAGIVEGCQTKLNTETNRKELEISKYEFALLPSLHL
jgi:hypothetical protein